MDQNISLLIYFNRLNFSILAIVENSINYLIILEQNELLKYNIGNLKETLEKRSSKIVLRGAVLGKLVRCS